jgi:hypothetical protein
MLVCLEEAALDRQKTCPLFYGAKPGMLGKVPSKTEQNQAKPSKTEHAQ